MIARAAFAMLRGILFGLALFAVLAHVLLGAGAGVPPWLLPLTVAIGVFAGRVFRGATAGSCASAPRWLLGAALLLPLATAAVLAYGALATPPRDWDGIVAWGLKANALAAAPTLQQPLFADPAVFHHSPDYPLLQPLCVAALGPALFPLLYLVLVALVGLAALRRTGDLALACAAALGIALLPDLIGSGGGAVDSGYAETFHALLLAAVAAALLLGDAPLLGAAAATLPFVKPEGTVHALLLVAAATALAPRRQCVAAVAGTALALAVWLPLQLQLAHAPPASPWLPLWIALGALLVVGLRLVAARTLRGRTFRPRAIAFASTGVVAAFTALLLFAQPLFAGSRTVLFAHYLGDLDRALQKLPMAGTILGQLAATALSPRRFGALFLLLAVLAVLAGLRRGPVPTSIDAEAARGQRSLALFFALALLAIVAAFFLSPEADVRHHLRSSAGRLLLQLAGAGWLLVATALLPWLRAAGLPGWLARALGRPAT